ncbi:TatD family hydrolase [Candidatus Omnitrophota bacterium]
MLIETHAHLDFPEYNNDLDDVIKRSKEAGVEYIINVGANMEGSLASVELSRKYDMIFASCGIHPHDASTVNKQNIEKIKDLVGESKKVVAIGEIGLDFYRNLSPRDKQLEVFEEFVLLSKECDLPLILHCREEGPSKNEASELIFKILDNNLKRPFKAVMHCFSQNEDVLRKCLDRGMHISFTCNITYPKAEDLREVLKSVPLDRLLLETDSPFLSPQVHRGKRNEPAYLRYLVDEIASVLNMQASEIERITTENAKKFFWGRAQRGQA